MGGSFSHEYNRSSGRNFSHPQSMTGDLGWGANGGLRGGIGDYFKSLLSQGSTALSTPQGILGPLYQNMFGQDGSQDYLGARQALQNSFSGEGLGQNVQTAYNQLQPLTERSIQEGGNAIRTAAGPLGLRFSTDVTGQLSNFANKAYENLGSQSLTAGLAQSQNQANSALNFYNIIGQLSQAQNPLAQLLGYATQFPSIGNWQFGSTGSRGYRVSGSGGMSGGGGGNTYS